MNASTTTSMDPVVSIIVVSYNTREMTLECLESIRAETTTVSFEVLFVDNQSSDGSLDAVRERFGDDPRYLIKDNDSNLGFAVANNHLAEQASGRYLLLLNPDTVVLDHAIDRIVAFAESHPRNGIWGGRTLFEDGSLNPTNCFGPYTLWALFCASIGLTWLFPRSPLFNPRAYPGWDRTGIREVGMVTGCLLLMENSLWKELRGFDPEFFMYAEEADLCARAIDAGRQPIISGEPTIIHHGGASEKTRAGKQIKLLDGNIRYFRRHWSRPAYRIGLVLIDISILIRAMSESLRRRPTADRVWSVIWSERATWRRSIRGGSEPKASPR